MAKVEKGRRGPIADRLKLKGDWKDLIGKALRKKRPDEGWPEPERQSKKKK